MIEYCFCNIKILNLPVASVSFLLFIDAINAQLHVKHMATTATSAIIPAVDPRISVIKL